MRLLFLPKADRKIIGTLLLVFLALGNPVCHWVVAAQEPATKSSQKESKKPQASRASTAIQTQVNVAAIPVIVRDSFGRAVGGLQKENFQVFDNGKLQEISQFTSETAETNESPVSPGVQNTKRFAAPVRFTAMLYDDAHLKSDTLPQLRAASLNRLSRGLAASERVAIFTTSGRLSLDFTDDRAKLEDALKRLESHPLPGATMHECPDISFEEANQILNRLDSAAKEDAIGETQSVCGIKNRHMAEEVVMSRSQQALELGDMATNLVLRALVATLERLSTVPGQRNLVLLSPGFLISDFEHAEYQIIDIAIRNHVVISSLDARGVLTDEHENEETNPLGELADGTGGTFYHNNNNLEEGIRRITATPEFRYILVYSPSDLKHDGAFHKIKVKIVGREKLGATWRLGYFAPRKASNSAEAEKSDFNESLFSRGNLHGLPIQMRTQFISEDKPVAKLSVLTLVDLREMPHRQKNGVNENELHIVAAIFDRNGKYMGSIDRNVTVQWPDDKAEMRTAAKYDFILDSGSYLVRLVVRDSESSQISTEDAVVQIP
jgi:VWFA-related protein